MIDNEKGAEFLSLEEKSESIEKEILKEKNIDELAKLFHDTERLLVEEHEKGGEKLKEKIGDIESKESFTDGRIRYIPQVEGGLVKVFTDTHGEPKAIENQLDEFIQDKIKGENRIHLASLGDMTNLGPQQIRNVTIFLELKQRYPEYVHLLKGNCEEDWLVAAEDMPLEMHEKYGFKGIEVVQKDLFAALDQLPEYIVCGNNVIMTHGGPPKERISGLIGLNKISEDQAQVENWTDINPGIEDSQVTLRRDQGGSVHELGEKPISNFLDDTGATVLLRGHQKLPGVKEKGFEIDFEGKCGTFMSSEQPKLIKREDGLYEKKAQVKTPRFFEMPLDKKIEKLEDSMFKTIA